MSQINNGPGYTRPLRYLTGAGVAVLLALVAGCTSVPDPLEVSEVQSIEATVTEVDASRGHLRLRGPEGREFAMNVGPEVRNLAQVKPGDTLRVSYKQALLAEMSKAGVGSSDVPVSIGIARSEEGEMPAGAVGSTVQATVTVISVSGDGSTLTFRGPAGELNSIDVLRDKSRAFVKQLRPGDLVDLTYSEALAIEIERMP